MLGEDCKDSLTNSWRRKAKKWVEKSEEKLNLIDNMIRSCRNWFHFLYETSYVRHILYDIELYDTQLMEELERRKDVTYIIIRRICIEGHSDKAPFMPIISHRTIFFQTDWSAYQLTWYREWMTPSQCTIKPLNFLYCNNYQLPYIMLLLVKNEPGSSFLCVWRIVGRDMGVGRRRERK